MADCTTCGKPIDPDEGEVAFTIGTARAMEVRRYHIGPECVPTFFHADLLKWLEIEALERGLDIE